MNINLLGLVIFCSAQIFHANAKCTKGNNQAAHGGTKPEDKRPQCIRYGKPCDRENEHDYCCLENGGICRTVLGRGRVCAPTEAQTSDPTSVTFQWKDFFAENFLKWPGWNGGGYGTWDGSTYQGYGIAEKGDFTELQQFFPILNDPSICNTGGPRSFYNAGHTCILAYSLQGRVYATSNNFDTIFLELDKGVFYAMHDKYLVDRTDAVTLADHWRKKMLAAGY